MRQGPAVGRLVERHGVGGRHRLVEVPDLLIERERDDDGGRARLAGPRDPNRLEDRAGDLRLVADFEQGLDDRAENGGIGQPVHLPDRRVG